MSVPYISEYGEVLSSSLEPSGHERKPRIGLNNLVLMQGQIQQIYSVDDPQNNPVGSGKHTLYDVTCSRADGSSEIVTRCRMLQPMFGGGVNNFMEVLSTNPGPQAKDRFTDPSLKRGAFVLVGLIDGDRRNGIILGTLPHPSDIATNQRPKKAKGTHLVGEFQGLNWQIDNLGGLKITFNGPKSDQGVVTGANGPTVLQITPEGNISATTNLNQAVMIDRVKGTITIDNQTGKILMDQKSGKITVNCMEAEVLAKQNVTVDAIGKATIKAKADVTVSSVTKIKLARGEGVALEPFVMGQQLVSILQELITNIMGITHVGNLGAPTPPPTNIAAFTAMIPRLQLLLSTLIVGDK